MQPRRCLSFAFVVVLLVGTRAAAQAQAPVVTMSITTPDGRTHELTAAESGLATLTLKDAEYAFRPTIQGQFAQVFNASSAGAA